MAVLCGLWLCSIHFGAVADEVEDQIDQAKGLYGEGLYRDALQELQYAIAQIQEKLNDSYVDLLPDPLPGWRAEAAEALTGGMMMMGGGTQLTRDYYQESGGAHVSIQLMADSPMLSAMSMMIANPMMMQVDPGTKPYRAGRSRGMIKHQQGTRTWEITLMIANRILVIVSGSDLGDKGPVEAYLNALDMAEIEKAFLG